jgi:hypothetical protein
VDFYCHEVSLILELDGAVHEINKEADLQRETILQEMGFRIIRFRNEEVIDNIEEVVSEIERRCVSDLTPSPPQSPSSPSLKGKGGGGRGWRHIGNGEDAVGGG